MSLFQEISLERSCEDAQISSYWCACNNWITVDPNKDKLVDRAAETIVDAFNKLVKESDHDNECESLKINSIKRSLKMMPKNCWPSKTALI